MQSNYLAYDHLKGVERLDSILEASDSSFIEVDSIPSRDKLTFTNGFYVNCSALFADIRGSADLPKKYRRPTLAKIYRAYISELVAVINGSALCSEISIVGDSVSGVFDTPFKANINAVFATAAQVASLVKILNCRLARKGIDPLNVGIGLSYGRALMIKAGYSGSGINDVVWSGDVLNEASHLCRHGLRTYLDSQMMVSSIFYDNLSEENQKLLSWNAQRNCYHGNVVNTVMEDWYQKNCTK